MKRNFLSLLPICIVGQILLTLLFSQTAHANIGASPAINLAGQVLYVRSMADGTGSELVKTDATNPSVDLAAIAINAHVFSSPVIDADGFVYVATLQTSSESTVYADDAKIVKFDSTLNKVWEFDAGSSVYSTVALTNNFEGAFASGQSGQLFFGTKDGNIISINSNDGSQNWLVETGFEIGGNAVLWPVNDSLVVANHAGEVLFLDQSTGAVNHIYSHPDRAAIMTPALLADGQVVIATFNGDVIKLNNQGQEVWRYKFGEKFVASPVVDKEGFIYVADYNTGDVISIYDRGLERWRYNSGNAVYASLLLTSPNDEDANAQDVDGQVVVADLAGNVIQLDKHTGQQVASQNTGADIYAAVNMNSSNIITVNRDANLSIIETSQHLANAQVAKFQIDSQNSGSHIDTDGDGYADAADAFPNDASEWLDTDRDGIGNVADLNDDGDSCDDINDTYPLDGSECLDTDGDLIGDNVDLDDDNDGMSDIWEENYLPGSSKVAMDLGADDDNDGLSNELEFTAGTNPYSDDTDEDGLTDIAELSTERCQEFDGQYPPVCLGFGYTSPIIKDTDGDGASDGFELNYGFSPVYAQENQDPDTDGYVNSLEEMLGTDPLRNEFDSLPFEFVRKENLGVGYITPGLTRFSPDGKHLYNYRGTSNLYVTSVDLETGDLLGGTRIAGAESFYSAEKMVFSKNGRFVLYQDYSENEFYLYERNLETGMLTKIGSTIELELPSANLDVFIANSAQGLEKIHVAYASMFGGSICYVTSYDWDQETGALSLAEQTQFDFNCGNSQLTHNSLSDELFMMSSDQIRVLKQGTPASDFEVVKIITPVNINDPASSNNLGETFNSVYPFGQNGEFYVYSDGLIYRGDLVSETYPTVAQKVPYTPKNLAVNGYTENLYYTHNYSNSLYGGKIKQTDGLDNTDQLNVLDYAVNKNQSIVVHPTRPFVYTISDDTLGQEVLKFSAGVYGIGHPDNDGDGLPAPWEDEYAHLGFDKGAFNEPTDDYDSDGLTDFEEYQAGTRPDLPDTDGDLVNDGIDVFPLDGSESEDLDGDGIGNNSDPDIDGDGRSNGSDAFPLNRLEWLDTDSDGTGNNADTDDDGDGVLDVDDAFPLDSTETIDTDMDGVGNNADTDDDGDGVADGSDFAPLDPTETLDTDGDGTGNNADTDDDGDGVEDIVDAFPLDSTETIDTDLDGIGNNTDPDDDGDGIADISDEFPLNGSESADFDGDGEGNNSDLDDDNDGMLDRWELDNGLNPFDNTDSTSNTDGDGYTALEESQHGTDPALADTDGDEVNDDLDAFPLNAGESTDTDADGIGDNSDDDIDGDGLKNDWEERYDFDPYTPAVFGVNSDTDSLTDFEEHELDTNPLTDDTDGDELKDDFEVRYGFNPDTENEADFETHEDPDGDLYDNLFEQTLGRNPLRNEFDSLPFEFVSTETVGVGYITPSLSRFSPDGRHLYTYRGQTNLYVTAVDLETGGLTGGVRISGAPYFNNAEKAVFSKNGRFVLYQDYSENEFYLYERNLETGMLTKIGSTIELDVESTFHDVYMAESDLGVDTIYLTQSMSIGFGTYECHVMAYDWDQETGALSSSVKTIFDFSCGGLTYNSLSGELFMKSSTHIRILKQETPASDFEVVKIITPVNINDPASSNNLGETFNSVYPFGQNGEFYVYSDGLIYRGDLVSETYPTVAQKVPYTPQNLAVNGYTENLYYTHYYSNSLYGGIIKQTDGLDNTDQLNVLDYAVNKNQSIVVHPTRPFVYTISDDTLGQEVLKFSAGVYGIGHPDTDGDGVRDLDDAFRLDPAEQYDSDGDGMGNNADVFPYDPTEQYDTDGDGIGNNADPDDDNDGYLDENDAYPLDATEWLDTDSDGIGNNADWDDDDDGMSDEYETNNGLNSLDASDRDLDLDGDGLSNYEESELGTLANNTDSDGDSIPDGWEVTYGMDPTLTADGLEDWDSDGHSNAAEYIVNTSPLDPRWYPGAPGLKKWGFDSGDMVRSSVAFGTEGQAYFVNESGILYAVDSDGGEIWQFDTAAQVVSSPAIGLEGEIYYTDMNGDLTAVANNGDELWTFTIGQPITTTPTVGDNGVVFFGADDGVLYAVDVDGSEKWIFETDDAIKSSPRIDKEGVLHFGSDDGSVYAVHSESGMEYRP